MNNDLSMKMGPFHIFLKVHVPPLTHQGRGRITHVTLINQWAISTGEQVLTWRREKSIDLPAAVVNAVMLPAVRPVAGKEWLYYNLYFKTRTNVIDVWVRPRPERSNLVPMVRQKVMGTRLPIDLHAAVCGIYAWRVQGPSKGRLATSRPQEFQGRIAKWAVKF